MVISITVVLSIAARSVTTVRISSQTEQSQRAFSAAEAGIEDALRKELGSLDYAAGSYKFNAFLAPAQKAIGSESTPKAQYSVNVAKLGESQTFKTAEPIAKDDSAQINLKKDTGTEVSELEIYWTDVTGVKATEKIPEASVEITQVYFEAGLYKLKKYAFNPSCLTSADDGSTNNFISSPFTGFPEVKVCSIVGGTVGSPPDETTFSSKVKLTILPDPQLVIIRPLYNLATIAVKVTGGGDLPVQAYKIESTGTFGQVSRKVEVIHSVGFLPPIFDFVLYSGSGADIIK